MNIITIGSKVMDDAVNRSGRRLINSARIVNISPLSFCEEYSWDVTENRRTEFINSLEFVNDYTRKMFELDIWKNMYNELKDVKNDYLVFDLSIVRIFVHEFIFQDGSHFRLTENQSLQQNIESIRVFLQKYRGNIINERVINPFKLDENSLKEEISKYISYLTKIAGEKIACVQIKNVGQYISKKNTIELLEHQNVIYDTNVFYERCNWVLANLYKNIEIIECPRFLIGDERNCLADMFNYNTNYYTYIGESVLALKNEDYSDVIRKLKMQYETKQKLEIEEVMVRPILLQTNMRYKNRKIVLIGKSEPFEYQLKKLYGLNVDKIIDFDENTDSKELEKKLEEIKYKNKEYFCVVPVVYNDLLPILWKCGYGYAIGYCSMSHVPYRLENFVGHYEDIYNNVIDCEKPVTLEIRGCGNRVTIKSSGKNFRIILLSNCTLSIYENIQIDDNFSMRIYDGAYVCIGKNSKIKRDCHIRGFFFTKTMIGEKCVLGERVIIFNGDGHAIIDLNTGENLNYVYRENTIEKHQIIIGNHTFIGDDSFVLSGSNIGNDSVVRENSFVNKKFADRQYLGGHPAKVIQDNIEWRD